MERADMSSKVIPRITTGIAGMSALIPYHALAARYEAQVFTSPIGSQNFCQILQGVTTYFFQIMVALGVLMILVSAFLFMTSGGEPEKINQAKKTLLFAVVGVAVGVLSAGIVSAVFAFFNLDPATCNL